MTTEPSNSPKRTRGRRNSGDRKPLPTMRTSPPGKAAPGATASMCGWPFTFFFPKSRLEIVIETCQTVILKEARNAVRVASRPARKARHQHHPQQFLSLPAAAPIDAPAGASQYRTLEKV